MAAEKKIADSLSQGISVLVLIALPLMLFVWFMWHLHTPTPRPKTSTVITRNSLLPHRFAGPCLNCHRVLDIGPVTMNRKTMSLFNLTTQQRRLIMEGQSVEVPTLAQKLRIPAIQLDDILPHPYVGVCSNCHIELDIRPSKAFIQRGMMLARTPVLDAGLSRERVQRGGERLREHRAFQRNIWGMIAAGLFTVSLGYIVARNLMSGWPQIFKGRFKLKRLLLVHEWASTFFTGATVLHWYYSDRGNNYLHVALITVIWLAASGYTMRYKLATGRVKKGFRLVHTQRYVFSMLLVLLVAGHFFAEFH